MPRVFNVDAKAIVDSETGEVIQDIKDLSEVTDAASAQAAMFRLFRLDSAARQIKAYLKETKEDAKSNLESIAQKRERYLQMYADGLKKHAEQNVKGVKKWKSMWGNVSWKATQALGSIKEDFDSRFAALFWMAGMEKDSVILSVDLSKLSEESAWKIMDVLTAEPGCHDSLVCGSTVSKEALNKLAQNVLAGTDGVPEHEMLPWLVIKEASTSWTIGDEPK